MTQPITPSYYCCVTRHIQVIDSVAFSASEKRPELPKKVNDLILLVTQQYYAGHRFPPEVIGHAVWPYFRFPLGLRMVEEMLAARGITVSHETIRQWALKFGQTFANRIRRRLPRAGDEWHLS